MATTRFVLALAISAGLAALAPANAANVGGSASAMAAPWAAPLAHTVDYRGYRGGYYRGGYRGYRNRNIGLGIGAAIIGGVIISQAARAGTYSQGARQHCADTYRSFDWESGTYMGYDGERHVCPYLR